MFKLESYLTPWLLGYLDKYVKLKPEDFQLSLWGGDAVFTKLDLRLNIIENLTNIPITFKSGVIHELRIHVPWTRITSEPVVVTINTLEFVAKLKESSPGKGADASTDRERSKSPTGEASPSPKSSSPGPTPGSPTSPTSDQDQGAGQAAAAAAVPAGYIQTIINKILFNICIIVNNVIVKFVEDDMVLSFNMKSAECYSVNKNWEKTYVDVTNAANLHLRKILQLNDVTICLDKLEKGSSASSASAANRIIYQDPLIYRCSIQSRLDFKYTSLAASPTISANTSFLDPPPPSPPGPVNPILKLIKMNFYCRKFDVSISDQQLPMVIRLLELILAISDGTLSLPPKEDVDAEPGAANDSTLKEPSPVSPLLSAVEAPQMTATSAALVKPPTEQQLQQDAANQGWISWAWSYVPALTTPDPEEERLKQESLRASLASAPKVKPEPVKVVIGVYIDELNVSIKVVQQVVVKQQKVYQFIPFMHCYLKGIGVEINQQQSVSHILLGVSYINLKSVGECCCRYCARPDDKETTFLNAGVEYLEEKTFHYLSGSLFDDNEEDENANEFSLPGEYLRRHFGKSADDLSGGEDADQSLPNISDSYKSRDKFGNFDETYGLSRFGAIFMDLLSTVNLDPASMNDKFFGPPDAAGPSADFEKEMASMYFIFYNPKVNISANLVHRALKMYERSQAHSYIRPYSSMSSLSTITSGTALGDFSTSQATATATAVTGNEEPDSRAGKPALTEAQVEAMAKRFEKYLPLRLSNFVFKEPVVVVQPFSHLFMSASLSQQHAMYESTLNLQANYFNLTITKPIYEQELFDTVTKMVNPPKKLIDNSYTRLNLISDGCKFYLNVTDNQRRLSSKDAPAKASSQQYLILEPSYFEVSISNVILEPDLWIKQYFPLKEIALEVASMKFNLQKQMLFILDDYLEHYVLSIVNGTMLHEISGARPLLHAQQAMSSVENNVLLRRTKLRNMIYKRLLEDFSPASKYKRTETLKVCFTELKVKYAITNIMHIVSLNCGMFNVYLFGLEQPDKVIATLLDTAFPDKQSAISDFLVVRAQLPLNIHAKNSYIPDPLFIYANMNEINVTIVDELLAWLNYKPTRGDDDLLNLLIFELFQDFNAPSLNSSVNEAGDELSRLRLMSPGQATTTTSTAASKHSRYEHMSSTGSLRSMSTATRSSVVRQLPAKKRLPREATLDQSIGSSSNNITHSSKPTVIDTVHDLIKSFHLQINLKSVTVNFERRPPSTGAGVRTCIVTTLPHITVKSIGTKCDLGEELFRLNSRQKVEDAVELPCSYLRACEKTSDKLPWLVDLTGLRVFSVALDGQSATQNIVESVDLSALFTLKPVYHNYDNLLSSLSVYFNTEMSKSFDLNLKLSQLDLIVHAASVLLSTLANFRYKIDYDDFESKQHLQQTSVGGGARSAHERHGSVATFPTGGASESVVDPTDMDDDDRSGFSTISILREYELSTFEHDDDGGDDIFDDDDEADFNEDELDSDYYFPEAEQDYDDHCSFSTGGGVDHLDDVSSSSSGRQAGPREDISAAKAKRRHHSKNSGKARAGANKTGKREFSSFDAGGGKKRESLDSSLFSPKSNIYITREKTEEAVKLNFIVQSNVSNFNLRLIDDSRTTTSAGASFYSHLNQTRLSLNKLSVHIDLTNAFQKVNLKLKRLQVVNEPSMSTASARGTEESALEELIVNTDPEALNKNLFNYREGNAAFQTSTGSGNFLEATFTRALLSNLNQRLRSMERRPSHKAASREKSTGQKTGGEQSSEPTPGRKRSQRTSSAGYKAAPAAKKKPNLFQRIYEYSNLSSDDDSKYISEIDLSLGSLDLLVHAVKFEVLAGFYAELDKLLARHFWPSAPVPSVPPTTTKREISFSPSSSFVADRSLPEYLKSPQPAAVVHRSGAAKATLIPLVRAEDVPLVSVEVKRVRVVMPYYRKSARFADLAASSEEPEALVFQLLDAAVSSQNENPVIRNFLSHTASSGGLDSGEASAGEKASRSSQISQKIYNKFRSKGLLYSPGFAFEDRQYSFRFNGISVFDCQAKCLQAEMATHTPGHAVNVLLDNVDVKAVIGLPIVLKARGGGHRTRDRLINGYIVEVGSSSPSITLYLNNKNINLLVNTLDENLARSRLLLASRGPEPPEPPSKRSSGYFVAGEDQLEPQKELELIPIDLLVTTDNLSVSFSVVGAGPERAVEPLFLASFVQPHVCLLMHKHAQKFELSVFDFSLKRSVDGGGGGGFQASVIETKPGDPSQKSGILAGFFQFRISNFASLFAGKRAHAEHDRSVTSAHKTPQHGHTSHAESAVVICSCSNCLRCYELHSSPEAAPGAERNRSKGLDLGLSRLKTKISFERPIRLKLNMAAYAQLNAFLSSLDLFSQTSGAGAEPPGQAERPENEVTGWKGLLAAQLLFSLNVNLLISQVVFVFETHPTAAPADATTSDSLVNLCSSFSSLNLVFNSIESNIEPRQQRQSLRLVHPEASRTMQLIRILVEHPAAVDVDLYRSFLEAVVFKSVNELSLQMNDLQSKIQIVRLSAESPRSSSTTTAASTSLPDSIDIFGPVSLSFQAFANFYENEYYSLLNFGSLNLFVNKQIVEFIGYLSSLFPTAPAAEPSQTPVRELAGPVVVADHELLDEQSKSIVKYEDDMRKGSFKYKIVDEHYLKKVLGLLDARDVHAATAGIDDSELFAHLKLPEENEILCVDDIPLVREFEQHRLSALKPFDSDASTAAGASCTSHVCWRYARRRALVNVRIHPLPFVGDAQSGQAESRPGQGGHELKCFLEYFNHCTKRFAVLREFVIQEASYTVVLDNIHQARPDDAKTPPRLENLIYSRIWRIRLSKDAKKYIYASSLLASTRVDSIELNQSVQPRPLELLHQSLVQLPGARSLLHAHAEVKVNSLELKLNAMAPAGWSSAESVCWRITDLFQVNLSELGLQVAYDEYNGGKTPVQVRNYLTFSLLSQLAVEYTEYRFLTVRSLLDSFQFKVNGSFSLARLPAAVELRGLALGFNADCLNFQVSQSSLLALRQLENEWSLPSPLVFDTVRPPALSPRSSLQEDRLLHYYLVYNDTAMPLNIKQFDTEETCPIASGSQFAYTWRTHKKAQTLQLYLPKYRLVSEPFQINEDGVQELRLSLDNASVQKQSNKTARLSYFVGIIVNVQTSKSYLTKPGAATTEAASSLVVLRKKVYLQSKLVVCNYLNVPVQKLHLKYSLYDKENELLVAERIEPMSRSSRTYDIVQLQSYSDGLELEESFVDLNLVQVNSKIVFLRTSANATMNVYSTLRTNGSGSSDNGLLCHDKELNVKYWLNIYEQQFKTTTTPTTTAAPHRTIIQYNVVLTPLFVLCSYLPYKLALDSNNEPTLPANKCLIEPYKPTYFASHFGSSNDISLKFEHVSGGRGADSTTTAASAGTWFERDLELMNENGAFNVSACRSDSDRQLIHADLFKYMTLRNTTSSLLVSNSMARDPNQLTQPVSDLSSPNFNINILTPTTPTAPSAAAAFETAGAGEVHNVPEASEEVVPAKNSCRKFLIEQKQCWIFSKTIRIDIRPVCLLVNNTQYRLGLTRKLFSTAESTADEQIARFSVDSNGGQLCLSEIGSQSVLASSGKIVKYKFSIMLDEYSIENQPSSGQAGEGDQSKAAAAGSAIALVKREVEYESEWLVLNDEEQAPPFYRDRQLSSSNPNCLYLGKCWTDLKLCPKRPPKGEPHGKAKLKLIYLVLSNDDWTYKSASPSNNQTGAESSENGGNASDTGSRSEPPVQPTPTRVLTVKPKFVFSNKTGLDLKFQLKDDYNPFPSYFATGLNKTPTHHFLNEYRLNAGAFFSTGDVVDTANLLGVSDRPDEVDEEPESTEEDADVAHRELIRELNDLYYLSFVSISRPPASVPLRQSKLVLLNVKEKAFKQTSGQALKDENLLVSRQAFSLYYDLPSKSSDLVSVKHTSALLCVQKLVLEKNNGTLLVVIEEDRDYLINLYNCLDADLFIWPRISSNLIHELYVRNCYALASSARSEHEETRRLAARKRTKSKSSSPKSPTALATRASLSGKKDATNYHKKSVTHMHFVPARSHFKFNYDFIGTNQFPVDNLNEQVFFMFAFVDGTSLLSADTSEASVFSLSPSLCRIYESEFEVKFEEDVVGKQHLSRLFYLNGKLEKDESPTSSIKPNRYLAAESGSSALAVIKKLFPRSLGGHRGPASPLNGLDLALNIERLNMTLNDDYLSDNYQTEIIRLTCDQLSLGVQKASGSGAATLCNVSCGYLQLDNQMYDLVEEDQDQKRLSANAQKYDFPVILIPRGVQVSTPIRPQFRYIPDYFKSFKPDLYYQPDMPGGGGGGQTGSTFLSVKLRLMENAWDEMEAPAPGLSPTEVDVTIRPFELYLEDYFIYNLIKVAGREFLDLLGPGANTPQAGAEDEMYERLRLDLQILAQPLIRMRRVQISQIDALISLQTSLKIYLATYKTPVVFERFEANGLPWVIMSAPQLIKTLTGHYLTSLIFKAGWMIGSLDLIGTPTAFIQQVSDGVYDFLQMPYRGLRDNGPGGLLNGFTNGSLSLIRNLSAGTITSMTSFASFVSRNMDILSCDPHHMARQEQMRHQMPTGSFGGSLLHISSSFMISIMGAIGGLAEQPIQSVHNSDSLLKGVSKGLIGLVTKPVGAVAELINQTGQGLLHLTGVNRVPKSEHRLHRRALNKEFNRFSISVTKCEWKLIANSQTSCVQYHIHAMIDAVFTSGAETRANSAGELSSCYLVLNDEILYVVDKAEDMLLRAFYISQIDVAINKAATGADFELDHESSMLVVTLHNKKVESFINEYQRIYETITLDRLIEFVSHASLLANQGAETAEQHQSSVYKSIDDPYHLPNCYYYRFANMKLNSYLTHYSSIPCICGAPMCSALSYWQHQRRSKPAAAASASRSGQHQRNPSDLLKISLNTDAGLHDASVSPNVSATHHKRQPSNLTEMPKIHMRTPSTATTPTVKQALSPQSSRAPADKTEPPPAHQQQQRFVYYVDPRISRSFISIFNSLKRKTSNKGFQF